MSRKIQIERKQENENKQKEQFSHGKQTDGKYLRFFSLSAEMLCSKKIL